jgi:hypothetical protein
LKALGPSFPYYPRIAQLLDNTDATLLFSFYMAFDAKPMTAVDVERATGLKAKALANAVSRLQSFGLITRHVSRGPSVTVVNNDALCDALLTLPPSAYTSDLLIQKDTYPDAGKVRGSIADLIPPNDAFPPTPVKGRRDKAGALDVPAKTFEEIIEGALDVEAAERGKKYLPLGELMVLLQRWAKLWSKSPTNLKMTPDRLRAWRSALFDGWKPSDFAKAIHGMTLDDWSERSTYCDWPHVTRHMAKWTALYERHAGHGASRELAPVRVPTKLFKTKAGTSTRVPFDYQWDDAKDGFMADSGYTFDLASRKWVKQA